MFVVIQFPVVDGRAFGSRSGVVDRPDWGAPQISPLVAHRDFVRGFGRLAYRRQETSAAWVDEDFFAYARRALKFPTLQRRHFAGEDRSRWMVSCRFRRLFCDGEATARLEVGFAVAPEGVRGRISSDAVVCQLLGLPAVVPGAWPGDQAKDLVLLGPYVARRYAQASTRHGSDVAAGVVTAGDPIVVVEANSWESKAPRGAVDASRVLPRRQHLHLATTRTPHGNIETWYLTDAHRDTGRNVRLAILRQHAQEETLDRILRWVATGAIAYTPQSADGDHLERYINDATKVVNRETYRGVDWRCAARRARCRDVDPAQVHRGPPAGAARGHAPAGPREG